MSVVVLYDRFVTQLGALQAFGISIGAANVEFGNQRQWMVPDLGSGSFTVPGFAGAKALAVAAGIRAAVLAYAAAVLLWFIPRLAAKARPEGNAAGGGR